MRSEEYFLSYNPFHPILSAAAVNFFLIMLMLMIYCSSLARPAGYEIQIPRSGEMDSLRNDQSIRITAENVFYFNDRVLTFNELKKELSKIDSSKRSIFVHVDRRAQAGRVMDLWDLLKALGNSRVQVVTDQKN